MSTLSLQNIVERLKSERHRNSTRLNYYAIWKQFAKFYARLDIKPQTWEDRLVLFVGYLVEQGKQSSTVRSYLLAIRSVLAEDNYFLCENQFLITSLTKACRLRNDLVHTHFPIYKELMLILLREIDERFNKANQPYLAVMFTTLISTAYFGLFRIGEETSGSHPILARDVQLADNKRKIFFILRDSKTHGKESEPQLVKISSQAKSATNTEVAKILPL